MASPTPAGDPEARIRPRARDVGPFDGWHGPIDEPTPLLDWADVEALGRQDVATYAMVRAVQAGLLTREQGLVRLAYTVVTSNHKLLQAEVDRINRTLEPTFLCADCPALRGVR